MFKGRVIPLIQQSHCYKVNFVVRKPVFALWNDKGADQPAHLHSLSSTFVVCSLDSIICVVPKFQDSS